MNEKLRRYIDDLFANAPSTVRAVELKEELYQNLTDKYNDLIAEGKSEESAFNIAIASIGDVDSLITGLSGEKHVVNDKAKKRSALLVAIAISLYILCPVPVILLQDEMGVMALFWRHSAGRRAPCRRVRTRVDATFRVAARATLG